MSRRDFLAGCAAATLLGSATRARAVGAATATSGDVIADTTYGQLRGRIEDSVRVFRGVPYGASTAGARRWLPPLPPDQWNGVRDALELGDMAPQNLAAMPATSASARPDLEMNGRGPLSEDCLRLNVWTPAVGTYSGRRPVMVWYHGGAYQNGSGGALSVHGAHLAAKQDVVVVTVNHRLNVFGFLELGEAFGPAYADSGNVGLLDCVTALRWVRDNIAQFGGDPRNVTVFGQSGGGSKVCCMMAMPAARGLFHRAIAQSGSMIHLNSKPQAAQSARALLDALQVRTIGELQAVPMEKLLQAMTAIRFTSAPHLDGSVLPVHPFDPVAPAQSREIAFMTGTNATETTFFVGTPIGNASLEPIDEATLHGKVVQTMMLNDADAERLIAAFRGEYPAAANAYLYQLLSSQWLFTDLAYTLAQRQSAGGKAPVYVYYLDEELAAGGGLWHSPHTLDIGFAFDNIDRIPALAPITPDQRRLADAMSGAWAAFARSGNPNHRGMPRWDRFDARNRAVMKFGDELRLLHDPHPATRTMISELKSRTA